MTPQEFENVLKLKAKEVERYAITLFPSKAGDTALRFINGNFRAQGYQGSVFKRWKASKGTILIKSGALRSATYYTSMPAQVTIHNNMPYAKVHNEGFKGTINIKAHSRNKYTKSKQGTGLLTPKGKERTTTVTMKTGEAMVKAHTREVDIPQRQFMPTNASDSVVLFRAINREVTRDLNKILKL